MGRCVIIQLKKKHNIYTAAGIGFNHVHNTFIWKHPNYVFTWQKEPLQLPWHIKPFYKPACLCLYPRDLHQLHVYDYLYKSVKYINNSTVKVYHHSTLDFSSFQILVQCFFPLGALQTKDVELLSHCPPPEHTHTGLLFFGDAAELPLSPNLGHRSFWEKTNKRKEFQQLHQELEGGS